MLIHSATWTKPKPSEEVAELVGVGGFQLFRHGEVQFERDGPGTPDLCGVAEDDHSGRRRNLLAAHAHYGRRDRVGHISGRKGKA